MQAASRRPSGRYVEERRFDGERATDGGVNGCVKHIVVPPLAMITEIGDRLRFTCLREEIICTRTSSSVVFQYGGNGLSHKILEDRMANPLEFGLLLHYWSYRNLMKNYPNWFCGAGRKRPLKSTFSGARERPQAIQAPVYYD